MRHDPDWTYYRYGYCPYCQKFEEVLQQRGDTLFCQSNCGFKVEAIKFYARFKKKKTFEYYRVKHAASDEEQNMRDICSI